MLPDGDILIADIKNCRVLLITPGVAAPARIYGHTTQSCLHAPPGRFGSPNGAFPMADGHYLVTEINGAWVDELSLTGTVLWSTHPPGVAYPSDSNEISPDRYLTVDYRPRRPPAMNALQSHRAHTVVERPTSGIRLTETWWAVKADERCRCVRSIRWRTSAPVIFATMVTPPHVVSRSAFL